MASESRFTEGGLGGFQNAAKKARMVAMAKQTMTKMLMATPLATARP